MKNFIYKELVDTLTKRLGMLRDERRGLLDVGDRISVLDEMIAEGEKELAVLEEKRDAAK